MHYERAGRVAGYEQTALIKQAWLEAGRERPARALELLERARAIAPNPLLDRPIEHLKRLAEK